MRSIGASDADMERGQMRVEANVSLRPRGSETFGTRVEIKNMNSFRSVERAIAHEIERQAAALDAGQDPVQETRGWHEDRGETYRMRVKETSDDYRYFPEPDLPPLHLDPAWLDRLRAALPELPAARRERYQASLGLSAYDATVLVGDPDAAGLFEATLAADEGLDPKQVANWVTGDFLRLRNQAVGPIEVAPAELATLIRLVGDGSISRANAREILELHIASGDTTRAIIEARGFQQISDAGALGATVDEVLAANPAAVADYRAGKVEVVGFLVGQVMKATRGQANAALAQAAVRERLDAEAKVERPEPRALGRRGRPHRHRLHARARSDDALPGAQGAGRQRRALRSVARGHARGGDTGVGRDADPASPGRTGSRSSASSGSCLSWSVSSSDERRRQEQRGHRRPPVPHRRRAGRGEHRRAHARRPVPRAARREYLEDAREVAHKRGHRTMLGTYKGDVTVTSTGWAARRRRSRSRSWRGVTSFIRVGSTAALQPGIEPGDLIVSEGAFRNDGTTDMYVPKGYPAVPDLELTLALERAANVHGPKHGLGVHAGLNVSDDAFYAESPEWTQQMTAIGLLNVEMEASALYVVARQRGLRAGMICAVSSNLVAGTSVYDDEAHRGWPSAGARASRPLSTRSSSWASDGSWV